MAEVTNELLFELLRQIQASLVEMKATLGDHTRQFIKVREDIHGLRGDDLRRESIQNQMDVRLERIETRLNLNDTPH